MSKTATRFAWAEAWAWAGEAVRAVERHAERVVIAGSLRRVRDDVGDIDLVVLDGTVTNPWQHGAISRALWSLGYEQTKDGEKIASYKRDFRASLDLYYATEETWGITLLARTGSAAHNIKLVQAGSHRAPARRLSVARGILDTANNVVASKDEESIFKALGLPYIAPAQREAPELEHLVRQEEPA